MNFGADQREKRKNINNIVNGRLLQPWEKHPIGFQSVRLRENILFQKRLNFREREKMYEKLQSITCSSSLFDQYDPITFCESAAIAIQL